MRFHGLFNGAAVLGAAITGVALALGMSWRVVWVGIATVGAGTALYVRESRVPEPPRADHPSMIRAVAGLRHEGLVVLASVFGAAAMIEGGIATWGILYLRAHLGLGVLAGVSAYVVGESLATFARIGGGPIVGALGSRRAVRLGGLLAAFGIATEALCGSRGDRRGRARGRRGRHLGRLALVARRRQQRGAPSAARDRRGHRVRLFGHGRGPATRRDAVERVRPAYRVARPRRDRAVRRAHSGAHPRLLRAAPRCSVD